MICDIRVEGTFESAHRLLSFPQDHKCHGLHGHRWEVCITVRGQADPKTGIVMDYYEVQRRLAEVLKKVDHVYLNEAIPDAGDPTTENLCRWLWMQLHRAGLHQLVEVDLQESPGFGCTYRGAPPSNQEPTRENCPACDGDMSMWKMAEGIMGCSWCGYKEDRSR